MSVDISSKLSLIKFLRYCFSGRITDNSTAGNPLKIKALNQPNAARDRKQSALFS